jgi:hypothetical protein
MTVGALHLSFWVENGLYTERTFNGTFTEGVDYFRNGLGNLVLPTAGMDVTFHSQYPTRGVTSATGCVVSGISSAGYFTTAYPAGMTVDIRMKMADSATWGTWQPYTSAGFAAAFAAIPSYNSNIGFDFECRIQTTTAVAGRYINSYDVTGLTVDNTYTPTEIGYVQTGLVSSDNGTSVAIFDNTVPASPVFKQYGTITGGSIVFEYPYNFDGVATQIKFVCRAAGYDQAVISTQSYQAGVSIPLTMIPSEATTDADVAGITITGATSTIDLTASKTLAQLYQKSQWWAHQQANMGYTIPVVSDGFYGYTSRYSINVPTGIVLNGTGSISMGAHTLSTEFATAGAYTYTGGAWSQGTTVPSFNGGQVNIGGVNTYVFTMASNTIISMTPAASGTYNMSGVVFNGTADLRNTTAFPISVSVPSGTSTTTANNTGGTITVITPQVYQEVTITGAVAGTEIEIYDLTSATQLYVGKPTFPYTWTDPVAAVANRSIQIKAAMLGYHFIKETIGTCGTTTADFSVPYTLNQKVDAVYVANAVDGSLVTGITLQAAPPRIIINQPTNGFDAAGNPVTLTPCRDLYAAMEYILTTDAGIAAFDEVIDAPDTANYLVNQYLLKNTGLYPVGVTNGYIRDSITGSFLDLWDSSGGLISPAPDHVVAYAVNTGSGLSPSEQAQLATAAAGAASADTKLGTPAVSVAADIAALPAAVWNHTIP